MGSKYPKFVGPLAEVVEERYRNSKIAIDLLRSLSERLIFSVHGTSDVQKELDWVAQLVTNGIVDPSEVDEYVTSQVVNLYDPSLLQRFSSERLESGTENLRANIENFDEKMNALLQIPRVGPSMARALLIKFKTLEQIVDAGIEQLCTLSGIGQKKAELIVLYLSHQLQENKNER